MRARLLAANGTAANQAIIENQPLPAEIAAANSFELDAMDRWLTAIDNDHSGGRTAAQGDRRPAQPTSATAASCRPRSASRRR